MIKPNKVRFYRQKRHLTQKQLANLSGIRWQSTMSQIERGIRNPKYETKKAIARLLKVKPEDIFLL